MSYYRFKNEDGDEYGSVEVFYADAGDLWSADEGMDVEENHAGWYWRAGFPGCLPDGDAFGPFGDEQSALENAQDN